LRRNLKNETFTDRAKRLEQLLKAGLTYGGFLRIGDRCRQEALAQNNEVGSAFAWCIHDEDQNMAGRLLIILHAMRDNDLVLR